MTELLTDYRAWLIAGGATPDTVRGRCSGARRLLAEAGTADPCQIRPTDLVRLIAAVDSRWSKATYYAHAKSFAEFCRFAGMLVSFTEGVHKPPRPKSTPHPINVADFRRALALAEPDTAAMLLLAVYTGLRVHEIALVRGEHLREREGFLFTLGKGAKEAYIPVHPVLARRAETMPSEGWWFPGQNEGEPISRGTVWRRIRKVLLQANPKTTATPHAIRSLYGTVLMNSGAGARATMELMRHSDMSVTQGYLEVADERLRAAVALLPDFTVALETADPIPA